MTEQSKETTPKSAGYEAPSLVALGSLPDLTGTVGRSSDKDGGFGPAKRSQP